MSLAPEIAEPMTSWSQDDRAGNDRAGRDRDWRDRGGPPVVLDLSRLLSRVLHATPTGVDRVEMAFAQTLLRRIPDRLRFAATHPAGWQGALPTDAARRFLATTAERWAQWGAIEPARTRFGHALAAVVAVAPNPAARRAPGGRAVYLHLSARSLERTALLRAALRRENARFVPFVHDLLPISHPEFARPNGAALFRRKLETVAALADAVLVNSRATAEALGPVLAASGRSVPVHVAGLATSLPPLGRAPAAPGPPYFVMLGTIEPRKNHLLLLNVWRDLVATHGPQATPRLILIGRRGWENENVLDLLDRCPALRGVVEERSRPSDKVVHALLSGARALLMPSFAEGFGLPVVEALSLGVPVLASDLPALREAGGGVPDHFDPLDGVAWRRAILDYAAAGSDLRRAQVRRMAGWRPPSWNDQISGVLDFLTEISR